MEFIITFIFSTLPEFFLIIIWGAALFGFSLRKNWVRLLIMAALIALISEMNWGFEVSADLRIATTFLLMVVFYKLFLKDKWSISLFMSLVVFISLLIMEIIVMVVFLQIFSYEQILNNIGVKSLVIASYSLPLIPLIYRIKKKNWSIQVFFKKRFSSPTATYLWIAILFLIIFQVYMLIYLNYSFYINSLALVKKIIFNINGLPIYSLAILVLNILLIVVIIKLKNHYAKIEIHKTEVSYIENLEKLLSKLKMERHDFINEIQTIHGFTQAKMYSHLEEYMSELVQHIRTVNKAIKIKNVPVSALIHTKIGQIEKDGIELKITKGTDDTFPQIKGYDLVKIVSNLLDNAQRAILEQPKNNPYIEIYWGKTASTAVLKISNNGPKITEKPIDRIFKEGYTTKQDTENNGLGLAIVRSIIQKYKGLIEVESTEDRTSFIVKLPL